MLVVFHRLYLEKINDFKFLEKKKAAAKVFLPMVPNLHALHYAYVQISCMRQIAKQKFSQNFEQRQRYRKFLFFKKLLEFDQPSSYKKERPFTE